MRVIFKVGLLLAAFLTLSCSFINFAPRENLVKTSSRTTKQEMWPFGSAAEEGGVPIIDGILSKNVDTVKALLARDPTIINQKNAAGSNAMHIIAKQGHYKFPPAEIPQTLIDYKINVDEKNADGRTALEISLLSGWQKIAMLLLDNGADRSVVTSEVKNKITCPDCKRVVKQYNL